MYTCIYTIYTYTSICISRVYLLLHARVYAFMDTPITRSLVWLLIIAPLCVSLSAAAVAPRGRRRPAGLESPFRRRFAPAAAAAVRWPPLSMPTGRPPAAPHRPCSSSSSTSTTTSSCCCCRTRKAVALWERRQLGRQGVFRPAAAETAFPVAQNRLAGSAAAAAAAARFAAMAAAAAVGSSTWARARGPGLRRITIQGSLYTSSSSSRNSRWGSSSSSSSSYS